MVFIFINLATKNISFIINIVISTSYSHQFDILYRQLGLQVTEELRTSSSCTGNNYIRLVIDE